MAYKDSPYLEACIASIRSQTVQSQIYICTSTPSDFIRETASKYGIECYVSDLGRGVSNDWSFSLRQARTTYVTLVHQDDIYLPDYAEICQVEMEKSENSLMCFTDYTEIVGDQERTNNKLLRVKRLMLKAFMPSRQLQKKFWKSRILSLGCPVCTPSVMLNRRLLEGFQFTSTLVINYDWEAWCRLAKMDGRFVYVHKPLVKHRIHPDSLTSTGIHGSLRYQEDFIMFNQFWPEWIARFLVKLYSASYKSNRLE